MNHAPLLSYEDALNQLLAAAQPVDGCDTVPLADARGRVLAKDLLSPVDVPPLDNSAMDGYCLRWADITDASQIFPVSQRIAAGRVGKALMPGTIARIFTGAPLPEGADSVVMQEQCRLVERGVVLEGLAAMGQHVRRRGEDIRSGSVVLPAGTRLNAAHLGVAAATGADRLKVWRPLRVALFSTGDELALPGVPAEQLAPGAIYNSNRSTLRALLEGAGCIVHDLGVVPDDFEATRTALRDAARDSDLVLTSGGVSVGEEDHVKPAVVAEGSLSLWKIAIKPGKPLAFGHVRSAAGGTAAFIGLPGNPVSSFVTFLMLVRPYLMALQGTSAQATGMALRAEFDWPPGGTVEARREFLRVRQTDTGGLALYPSQGSGVLTSCARG